MEWPREAILLPHPARDRCTSLSSTLDGILGCLEHDEACVCGSGEAIVYFNTCAGPQKGVGAQFSILRCPSLRHGGGWILSCLTGSCHQHCSALGSEHGRLSVLCFCTSQRPLQFGDLPAPPGNIALFTSLGDPDEMDCSFIPGIMASGVRRPVSTFLNTTLSLAFHHLECCIVFLLS